MSYQCWTCLDTGCEYCPKAPDVVERIGWYTEPWPKETWYDLTDQDLEQLVCDGLDELTRRGKVLARLEKLWSM